QDGDCAGASVGDNEVGLGIAVYVGDCQRIRTDACRKVDRGGQTETAAGARIVHDRDGVCARVRDGDVRLAVTVDVRDCHPIRSVARRKVDLGGQTDTAAGAHIAQDGDRASAPVHDDDIWLAIAVDVRGC